MAAKADKRDNLWDNPNPEVPLQTAHLKYSNMIYKVIDVDDSDEVLVKLEHLNCAQNKV